MTALYVICFSDSVGYLCLCVCAGLSVYLCLCRRHGTEYSLCLWCGTCQSSLHLQREVWKYRLCNPAHCFAKDSHILQHVAAGASFSRSYENWLLSGIIVLMEWLQTLNIIIRIFFFLHVESSWLFYILVSTINTKQCWVVVQALCALSSLLNVRAFTLPGHPLHVIFNGGCCPLEVHLSK